MPSIVLPIQALQGPTITVALLPSAPRLAAMQKAGIALGPPAVGTFLIDTGASHTAVDKALLAQLGIPATGLVPIHTPSSGAQPAQCAQYDVGLVIPGPGGQAHPLIVNTLSVTEVDLSLQGIQGLIGRDVLSMCHLTYVGVAGQFVLSY